MADEAAAKIERPRAKGEPRRSQSEFPTPQPAPGGQVREYWVQARSVRWDIAPKKVDEWMKKRITGRTKFRAFVYQLMSTGFAEPLGRPRMPGPTLEAEVGDLLVVHFRNADTRLNQAVTMHPHGVKYNPEYDGSYLGDYTRAGGFIAPGEEFTYRWECTPDSVGVWPYHDHGPNHTLNTMRGLFGAVIVRPKGATRPDVEHVLMMHSFAPQVTRLPRLFQAVNGRSGAGNTPTIEASVGQDVAHPRDRLRQQLPHLPHPWPSVEGPERDFRGQPGFRSQRDGHRPLHGGQPRALAVALPRVLAPGRRDGGLVSSSTKEEK